MVVLTGLASALVAATYFSGALAHPDHADPVLLRRALNEQAFHTKNGARSLQACSGSASSVELQKQAAERRAATAQRLREERGLTEGNSASPSPALQCTADRLSGHAPPP